MQLAMLIIESNLIMLFLFLLSDLVFGWLGSRLDLGKGLQGNPAKMKSTMSSWTLRAAWLERLLTIKSPWLAALAAESSLLTLSFGVSRGLFWNENHRLIFPLIFLLSRVCIVVNLHRQHGEKHPAIRTMTGASLTAATGLVAIFYALGQPWNHEYGAIGATLRYVSVSFFWIILTPLLVVPTRAASIPKLLKKLSRVTWSVLTAAVFLPPIEEAVLSTILVTIVAAVFLIVLQSVEKLVSSYKIKFWEDVVLNVATPTLMFVLLLVFMGV